MDIQVKEFKKVIFPKGIWNKAEEELYRQYAKAMEIHFDDDGKEILEKPTLFDGYVVTSICVGKYVILEKVDLQQEESVILKWLKRKLTKLLFVRKAENEQS